MEENVEGAIYEGDVFMEEKGGEEEGRVAGEDKEADMEGKGFVMREYVLCEYEVAEGEYEHGVDLYNPPAKWLVSIDSVPQQELERDNGRTHGN